MTNPRPEKVAAVEGLEQRLKASSVIILTDYRGLSVDEIGALRGRLRDADVEYRVTKNTLLALAAERCGLHGLSAYLNGPTAAVFGKDDPGVAARLLQDFIRQYRKLEIKGAVIDGEALDADAVRLLATLPSRAEMQARAIATIQAPLRSIVTVLNSSASALVYVIEAYRSRREAEEGAATPSPAPVTAEAAPSPAPVTAEAAPSGAPGTAAAAEDSAPSGDTPALDVPTTPSAKDGAGSGDAQST